MVSQKVVIKNPTGLHLRPAGILCKEAMQFKSLITFSFRETTANAKSVLSVLGACVKCGDEIEIVCDGEDEEDALKALITAIDFRVNANYFLPVKWSITLYTPNQFPKIISKRQLGRSPCHILTKW